MSAVFTFDELYNQEYCVLYQNGFVGSAVAAPINIAGSLSFADVVALIVTVPDEFATEMPVPGLILFTFQPVIAVGAIVPTFVILLLFILIEVLAVFPAVNTCANVDAPTDEIDVCKCDNAPS